MYILYLITVQFELRPPTDEIYIQVMVFLELDLEEKIEGTEKEKWLYTCILCLISLSLQNSKINCDKKRIVLKIIIL